MISPTLLNNNPTLKELDVVYQILADIRRFAQTENNDQLPETWPVGPEIFQQMRDRNIRIAKSSCPPFPADQPELKAQWMRGAEEGDIFIGGVKLVTK